MTPEKRIRRHLAFLYGEEEAGRLWPQLKASLDGFSRNHPRLKERRLQLTQRDAILITYGDQIQQAGQAPLQVLADFLKQNLGEAINAIHLLPFYPYSSDDGFSVIDYRQVDSRMGDWQDISHLGRHFRLMFDAVVNHISRESEWFQAFRRGEEPYQGYFIAVDPGTDLSMVVRPRALPLLTPVETAEGTQYVWTTFSADQIDLNYANPQVLLEIVNLLLFYVAHGAEIIRLDAIAYLWKEPGTPSIHLPQTHQVVKLFRAVLDAVAPYVILITETNVPHQENISYFGKPLPGSQQTDEAQMVYQFPLAPLVLHTFLTGNSDVLSRWAASLETPSPATTFFNFIASHDGVGVRPAEGLLEPEEIQALVERTRAHGGQVSFKRNADGTQSVYELNISLYDMLNNPREPQPEVDVRRFLASQAIMLSLAGVPGIYVHSLLGTRNCTGCVERSGQARSINRKKFQKEELLAQLSDPASHMARVFTGYQLLLRRRRSIAAFHPRGRQRVLFPAPSIFALMREAPEGDEVAVCLVNVSDHPQTVQLDTRDYGLPVARVWEDRIGGEKYRVEGQALTVAMGGYEALWLSPCS